MSTLTFLTSPLGLSGQRTFELDSLDDDGVLFALRGTTASATRLFVIDPRSFFTGYAPELPADVLRALNLMEDDQARETLVVVHPGDDANPATVNLLAPIVLNSRTQQAEQVVLEDDRWPLRAELPTAA